MPLTPGTKRPAKTNSPCCRRPAYFGPARPARYRRRRPEKVSLGYIADVSQPARHHDIEQMYRQRTRQYKAELRKLEAQAAKERERLLAEERAHARRLAAMGEAAGGGADDQVQR